jgi:hypothetical protein
MTLTLKIELIKQIINDPEFMDDIIELNVLLDKYAKLYELIDNKEEVESSDTIIHSFESKYTQLIKAIRNNKYNEVKKLIDSGVDYWSYHTSNSQNSIMNAAALVGSVCIMKLLINHAKEINPQWYDYAFYLASIADHYDVMRYLKSVKPDIDVNVYDALYQAIKSNDLIKIKCLIEQFGAYANYNDKKTIDFLNKCIDDQTHAYLKDWKVKAIEYVMKNERDNDKTNTIKKIMSFPDYGLINNKEEKENKSDKLTDSKKSVVTISDFYR